ncbi:hypothetical protein BC938DRAFT_477237, partial [Jimgerdemannia flammicorona]
SYTAVLEKKPDDAVVLSNRAQAYLNLSQFREALSDAEAAVGFDDGQKKAKFRMFKALYGLKKYEEATATLEALNRDEVFEGNDEIRGLLRKANERVAEQRFGRYNIVNIVHEARSTSPPILDHAEYIGPVRVAQIPGRGRGVIVTRDVEEGTLLMCCKAFSVAFKNEVKDNRLNLPANYTNDPKPHLVAKIFLRLRKEPWAASELANLPQPVSAMALDPSIPPQVANVINIVNANFIVPDEDTAMMRPRTVQAINILPDIRVGRQPPDGAGLWTFPSFINHSCLDNAVHVTFGDMMFVRAARPIARGEEVLLAHVAPFVPYDLRVEYLRRRGIECRCSLCTFEDSLPPLVRNRRHGLQSELNALGSRINVGDPEALARLGEIICETRETYGGHVEDRSSKGNAGFPPRQLQFGLILPFSMLVFSLNMSGRYAQAVQVLQELFEIQPHCGCLARQRVKTAMALVKWCNLLGKLDERNRWIEVAKKGFGSVYGDAEDGSAKIWEEIYKMDLFWNM